MGENHVGENIIITKLVIELEQAYMQSYPAKANDSLKKGYQLHSANLCPNLSHALNINKHAFVLHAAYQVIKTDYAAYNLT